jgi:hypothetical protein
MKFLIVTSLITAALLFTVSAISIALFSWIYTGDSSSHKMPDSRFEIRWGEGS